MVTWQTVDIYELTNSFLWKMRWHSKANVKTTQRYEKPLKFQMLFVLRFFLFFFLFFFFFFLFFFFFFFFRAWPAEKNRRVTFRAYVTLVGSSFAGSFSSPVICFFNIFSTYVLVFIFYLSLVNPDDLHHSCSVKNIKM